MIGVMNKTGDTLMGKTLGVRTLSIYRQKQVRLKYPDSQKPERLFFSLKCCFSKMTNYCQKINFVKLTFSFIHDSLIFLPNSFNFSLRSDSGFVHVPLKSGHHFLVSVFERNNNLKHNLIVQYTNDVICFICTPMFLGRGYGNNC